jgi:putative transposase
MSSLTPVRSHPGDGHPRAVRPGLLPGARGLPVRLLRPAEPLPPRAIRHAWLTEAIRQVHDASRQTYGQPPGPCRAHPGPRHQRRLPRRGAADAPHRPQGVTGRPKLRRGLRSEATAADLVQRQFTRTGPDQLWLTDITEHRPAKAKVYGAVVLNACSRRVVGWPIDTTPTAALGPATLHAAPCALVRQGG